MGKRKKKQPSYTCTVEYIPMPEHVKESVYDEWVRIFLVGEVERLKRQYEQYKKNNDSSDPSK